MRKDKDSEPLDGPLASSIQSAQPLRAADDRQQRQERRAEIKKARAERRALAERRRLESERTGGKPDWSVSNVLSWIAFRDLARLCEIEDQDGLRREMMYPSSFLKAPKPESALLTALKRGEVQAIRNGDELPARYWYGKTEVDRNVWFERDSIVRRWRDDRWSLAQTMIWVITRDAQQVEDAYACGLDQAAAAIVIDERPHELAEKAASDLRQRCLEGALQSFEGRRPIEANEWRDLKIDFVVGAPLVHRCGEEGDIRFLRAEVLLEFPLERDAEFASFHVGPEVKQTATVRQDATTDESRASGEERSREEDATALHQTPGSAHTFDLENPSDRDQLRLARWVARKL